MRVRATLMTLRPRQSGQTASSGGFTLVEVLVSLVLGTLIVGGVMGVISVSLQFMQRVERKSLVLPVLEAAAQEILLHPEEAKKGSLILTGVPGKPVVGIDLSSVQDADGNDITTREGQLYRVQIYYRENLLELSLIIPEEDFE